MSTVAGASTAPRSSWSIPAVIAVMSLPIAGAIGAAWIELSEPGESAWWVVAGAWFLLGPGLAAWAALHSTSPTATRRLVAFALFAVLFAIWMINVPVRTQPGLYMGGGTPFSGFVIGAVTALGWDIATARAQGRLRQGSVVRAFASGALWLSVLSVIGFYAGFVI